MGEQALQWDGIVECLQELDSLSKQGAVVVIKMDGQRNEPAGRYSVIVAGREASNYFRKDGSDLRGLMSEALRSFNLTPPDGDRGGGG